MEVLSCNALSRRAVGIVKRRDKGRSETPGSPLVSLITASTGLALTLTQPLSETKFQGSCFELIKWATGITCIIGMEARALYLLLREEAIGKD